MRVLTMLGVLGLLYPSLVSAQFPVIDSANLLQNSISAVQGTITAVEAVVHTSKWILEQTPLDDFVMGAEWAENLEQMNALVREAQALGYDVGSLSSLMQSTFSLASAPSTTTELQIRLAEVRQHVSQAYSYAVRTQSLILTAQRTITHALALYDQLQGLLGNLSGQQNLSQQLTKLVQIQAESKVTANAYQLAQSMERMTEPLILESLERINEAIMADHPGRR